MGMKPITAVLVAAQRQASVFPLQRVKVSHEEPFPIFHYNEPWRQEKHGEVVLLQKVFVLVAQGGWVIIVDVVLAFGLAVGTLLWHCATIVTGCVSGTVPEFSCCWSGVEHLMSCGAGSSW